MDNCCAHITVYVTWMIYGYVNCNGRNVEAGYTSTGIRDNGYDDQRFPLYTVQHDRRSRRSWFLSELLKDYDNRVPPNFDTDEATFVTIDIFIGNVDSISESAMDYVITIFLRQEWVDQRLRYDHLSNEPVITLDSRMSEEVWRPDLFFSNEKKAHFHAVTVPNRFLRIYNNGTILYSARISLTLACPMRLQKFPLDTQVCFMQMESYAFTTDKLQFVWRAPNAVEMSEILELPQFKLENFYFEDCTKSYITGNFTCLQVNFVLRRDIGFYMIQTYIPSLLIVILSWVSFWISIDAIPARISLGVLTILTMTTQITGVRQSLPKVSYVKGIDIWLAACLLFVFAALLEFAIVNVLSRKEIRRLVTSKKEKALSMGDDNFHAQYSVTENGNTRHYIRDPFAKHKAREADKLSRKLFPIMFITFNIIYWCTYILWSPQSNS